MAHTNDVAIVCGFGHLGGRIVAQLRQRGCDVVAIDNHVTDSMRKTAESLGAKLIEGDIRDEAVIRTAGTESARCFIAATGDDCANLEAAVEARKINPSARIVARLYNEATASRVEKVFGIRALSASFLASPAYVATATDESIVSLIRIDGCHLGIRHGGDACADGRKGLCLAGDGDDLRIASDTTSFAPDTELFVSLHERPSAGLRRRRHARQGKTGRRKSSRFAPCEALARLVEAWKSTAIISKYLLVSFLSVGLLSVILFSWFGRMTPLDALYFVVTTMTTVGYGDFNLQNAPPGLKVYGILMMLCGAALLATIYAIIADRVLTARLDYLMGRHNTWLWGHTIVVGLGKVGWRVAHDLRMLGVDVVAVEINPDSDNVSAARSIMPVIIGDASRESVLSKAGVDRAEVILALAEDPMLNLNICLHARERNPSIKTILRTYEFDLADRFGSLGVDEAISTSAIAAPAFVDAALYPGVQASFRFGSDDVLVARYVAAERSPLVGKTVRSIGEELGIAVALVAGSADGPYKIAGPEMAIGRGEKLIVLLRRSKMPLLETSDLPEVA